jgi:hypothetical protein
MNRIITDFTKNFFAYLRFFFPHGMILSFLFAYIETQVHLGCRLLYRCAIVDWVAVCGTK